MSDDTLVDGGDVGDPTTLVPEDTTDTTDTTGMSTAQPIDTDDDGIFDALFLRTESGANLVVMDLDGDRAVDGLAVDANGDGVADLWITRQDGGYQLDVDDDGDGTADASKFVTREELQQIAPVFVEMLDTHLDGAQSPDAGPTQPAPDDAAPEDASPLVVDGKLIGDPQGASEHWFQQAQNGFCLPASIAQIVSEYTGVHYEDESTFVELANEHGAFSVGMDGVPGIEFSKGAELLQASGVPAHYEFGTMETLASDLAEGKGVIVFVDSGEYWRGESSEDNAPDHAVVVTAIDLERQTVTLSDPGTPGGDQEEIPLELFDNAWADSNHAMIVCDTPAPDVVDATPADGAPVEEVATPAPLGPDGQPIDGRPDPVTGLDDLGARAVSGVVHGGGWVLLPHLEFARTR